jgi:hypothetical protein
MAFLTLNGIPVPVVPSAGVRRAAHLGQYARSYNGTPYSTVRSTKVLILEYLIEGRGHVWSFDGVDTSSRGVPVLSSGGEGYEISADEQKYGSDSLKVLSLGGFVRWRLAGGDFSSSAWTMMFWALESSVWHHYARTSTGSYWKDGSTTSAGSFPSWVSFTSLLLRVDANGEERFVDDLVMLPYVVPSTWPALVYGAGAAFGPLPKHTVGGDWLASRCTQALCRWESTEPVNGWGGDVGAVVNFELLGD